MEDNHQQGPEQPLPVYLVSGPPGNGSPFFLKAAILPFNGCGRHRLQAMEEWGKIRILIAEDEVRVGDLLTEILAKDDRDITIVNDGRQAINEMDSSHYDILITDLNMPGVNGMEVIRHAKRVNPNILVIIVTGYASLESAIQAVKEGAYDYIRKPFRLDELQISIDNACEKIRLFRENRMLLERLKEQEERCQDKVEDQEEGGGAEEDQLLSQFVSPLPFLGPAASSPHSTLDALERLGRLRKDGVISEEEFNLLKKRLIV